MVELNQGKGGRVGNKVKVQNMGITDCETVPDLQFYIPCHYYLIALSHCISATVLIVL